MSRSTSTRPDATGARPVPRVIGSGGGATHWDVVVVGARVAGASTALLLARAGVRVLVVDRARRGSDTLSTHALMRGGVLQLRRWGLLDRVAATGVPAIRRVTFHYGAESAQVSLRPYAGVDCLYAPRRTVLDGLLVEAAERAGAQFRFGLAVTDLARDPGGRVVGVVVRDQLGRRHVERADLVVGADGRQSVVAERLAPPVLAAGSGTGSYVYGYWPATGIDGYHWYYGHRVSAGVIPTNDGLACVFAGGPASDSHVDGRRERPALVLRSRLAGVDDGLAALTASAAEGGLRWFRGLAPRVRRPFGDGWALVGDAGSWMDPLSTHGMTDALRDAESLARAIVSGAASERAAAAAFRDYQARRDRVALRMHPLVDRLASHAWTHAEARELLRGLASLMADEVEEIAGLAPLAAVSA